MMEMSPRDPVTLTLPPFRGAVRRLVIALLAVYLLTGLFAVLMPSVWRFLGLFFLLTPLSVIRHGYIWQLLTYPFFNGGILSFAFALLNLWFTGAMLEDIRGSRWFTELFYASAIGGGILATLLNRWPVLAYVGSGVLAWTAGRMVVHDHLINQYLAMAHIPQMELVLPGIATAVVIGAGFLASRRKEAEAALRTGEPAVEGSVPSAAEKVAENS